VPDGAAGASDTPFDAAYRAYLMAIKQAWADVDIGALDNAAREDPGLGFATFGSAGSAGTFGSAPATLGTLGSIGTFGSWGCLPGVLPEQARDMAMGAPCIATYGTARAAQWGSLASWATAGPPRAR
jgi:hypothetical protein